ncbi:sensor domain-containing diguanylate cyclase [Rhodoligotrophos appendicifer]|uniref:sensor domain-containing diguanylate cyclase n=1 Tax=Rhodoligotrophos appendicifer TaxID=987056 RepID=UPI001960851E
MKAASTKGDETLDLKEGCEREPIHVPGSIQPHGVLLVLDPNSEEIVQSAGDVAGLLGIRGSPLGKSVKQVLGRSLSTQRAESGVVMQREPTYLGTAECNGGIGSLTLTAHLVDGAAVLELEPAVEPMAAAFVLASISSISEQISEACSLLEAVRVAAAEVRRISGYDHIMVYQFLPDSSGSVVAESRAEGRSSFLNHRFPASDIPAQARSLYLRSPIRVIPDVEYVAAPLEPLLLPATNSPLDMSHCALRSVSPVHIKYLKNMGVGASMSVSLIIRGELWGLIACHNRQPMQVPYVARELCKHVAQNLSQKIRALSEADDHLLSRDLGSAAERLLRELHNSNEPNKTLINSCSALQELFDASGVAIDWKGSVATAGRVPSHSARGALAKWLRDRLAAGEIFVSDSMQEQYPGAAEFEREGSGLLSILLTGDDAPVLMWFKAEQVEEIRWAGNPSEPLELNARLGTLNPRKSFETWRKTVRGRSRPWRAAEVEMLRSFGRRLAFVLQQQRIRELNTLLQRANEQLANLAATDSLTGIANRRAFDARLDYEWARAQRHSTSLSLITLDLDFFKQYNDHFGHPAGDLCLRQVSAVVGEARRSTDFPARVGGEEFSILLPDTDTTGALVIAEKFRLGIQALNIDHPKSPFGVVTASLGLAVRVPFATTQVSDLIKAADGALYEAKAAGRNQIAVA